jgi:hypothetical protein
MRARILRRAGEDVRNKHAYVRAAEAEFLENLETEKFEWMAEIGQDFLREKIAAGVDPVPWTIVRNHIRSEAKKHDLEIGDDDDLDVPIRAANDALGLRENRPDKTQRFCAICGRPPAWHSRKPDLRRIDEPRDDAHAFAEE